jgi:hypothetical protein
MRIQMGAQGALSVKHPGTDITHQQRFCFLRLLFCGDGGGGFGR